ncbi:MAG TPA: arginine repressor [Actinomycetota bacterium]|nr:arginine repressor [Actinomycetota bacterium]
MPRSSAPDRASRRRRLLELLQEGFTGTQDEIVQALRAQGFTVTQATVSRDLDALGAVRRHEGDRFVYALPSRNGPPEGLSKHLLAELLVDLTSSGNMVVVRTFPGMASTVAAIIDATRPTGAIGTIAGDDTVFVVADERTGGRRLAERIRRQADERGAS